MRDLLSSKSLQQLKELERDFHAQLGDELRDKIRNAIPEIKENNFSKDRDILWWILHNQLEVIGRMEMCKDLVRGLIDLLAERVANVKDTVVKLEIALDHLKQNLTHLTGQLSDKPDDNFYVLDCTLGINAIDSEGARNHYHQLIEPMRLEMESTDIRQILPRLSQLLQDRGVNKRFSTAIAQVMDQMLSVADIYYAEVDGFIKCEPQPIVLFYHFRRVESAAMHLLSTVILSETIVTTLRYIFPGN